MSPSYSYRTRAGMKTKSSRAACLVRNAEPKMSKKLHYRSKTRTNLNKAHGRIEKSERGRKKKIELKKNVKVSIGKKVNIQVETEEEENKNDDVIECDSDEDEINDELDDDDNEEEEEEDEENNGIDDEETDSSIIVLSDDEATEPEEKKLKLRRPSLVTLTSPPRKILSMARKSTSPYKVLSHLLDLTRHDKLIRK